jgi:hypothetical protein
MAAYFSGDLTDAKAGELYDRFLGWVASGGSMGGAVRIPCDYEVPDCPSETSGQ